MSAFQILYGKTFLEFELPRAEWIAPAPIPALRDPARAVRDALDAPLDFDWARFARAQSVAIAINDKTRPVPLAILLPLLLHKLASLDIPRDAITFIIATGTHPPMRVEEFGDVVPREVLENYRVITHDCDDGANLIELGTTSRGTRVHANRVFVESDLRIAIGDIEPHQFMGFSGGVKAAAIGVAGRATITRNHAWMLDPHSYQGRYADNPARQDVEEIGKMMGVHCALNPVIDAQKKIVGVFAGDPIATMRAGMPLALAVYRVRVAAPFDLMIVSAGGHPKDINVYQAQKALGHAIPVMKPGGTIIWLAACPEGTGSKLYEEFMRDVSSHYQVLERFAREPFRLGYHKAFQIARAATRVRVMMITEMPRTLTARLLLDKYDSLDAALNLALRDLPHDARAGVMPIGNVTIPEISPAR
ncbi:MAG: nickel-dependent lactate racemase [Chloroflexi bacterium]|nr:nickel-dependent lactate racemase [Chloroflexota bacterium]